jgi:SAM-dependent methyltransferase
MPEDWNDAYETLSNSRWLYHNSDYWEFLVRTVWKLDRQPVRLVDFGCGFGRIGLVLMPLLAKGSTYTGFDTAEGLLEKGRRIYADLPYSAEFLRGNVHDTPFVDSTFDVAISHTVLMHVPQPEKGLAEMIRVTRSGGLVITCDAVRNAFSAMLHIHEVNEIESNPLQIQQAINRSIRQQTGVDYNLGVRMPILMHKAGLHSVAARVTDAVCLLFPPVDTPEKERSFQAMCSEGLGWHPTDPKVIRQWQEQLESYGIAPDAARCEIGRELDTDFAHKGRQYHTVWPGLLVFSFGTVDKG